MQWTTAAMTAWSPAWLSTIDHKFSSQILTRCPRGTRKTYSVGTWGIYDLGNGWRVNGVGLLWRSNGRFIRRMKMNSENHATSFRSERWHCMLSELVEYTCSRWQLGRGWLVAFGEQATCSVAKWMSLAGINMLNFASQTNNNQRRIVLSINLSLEPSYRVRSLLNCRSLTVTQT